MAEAKDAVSLARVREEAGRLFKEQNIEGALQMYLSALTLLDTCDQNSIDSLDRGILYSNAAQCALNLKRWDNAITYTTAALNASPNNVKALYRRALAYEAVENYVEAVRDAKQALMYDPSNKALQNTVDRLRVKVLKAEDTKRTEQLPATAIASLKNAVDHFIEVPNDNVSSAVLSSTPSKEDAQRIDQALRVLRSWIVTKKKRALFLTGSSLPCVIAVMHAVTLSPSVDESNQEYPGCSKALPHSQKEGVRRGGTKPVCVFGNAQLLGILMQILRFVNVLLLDQEKAETNMADSKHVPMSAADFNAPITVDPDVKRLRDHLATMIPSAILTQILKQCIRSGVGEEWILEKQSDVISDLENDNVSTLLRLRTTCVLLVLDFLRYTCNLESSDCLEALALAINAFESTPVVQRGLCALGYLADTRRRFGSRVVALKKTQPLMKVLENTLQRLTSTSPEVQKDTQFALTAVFSLLADKDRAPEDSVSLEELGYTLLGPYLDKENDEDSLDYLRIGLKGLLLLWATDRQAGKSIVLAHHYMQTIMLTHIEDCQKSCFELRNVAIDALMWCMEFPELRSEFLELDGLNILQRRLHAASTEKHDAVARIKLGVIISRLCIHEESVRSRVFEEVDLMAIALECISSTSAFCRPSCSTQATKTVEHQDLVRGFLEIMFFLCFHGAFKKMLLSPQRVLETSSATCEKDILQHFAYAGQYAVDTKDALSSYYFANNVCNLLRTRDSKEPVRRPRVPGAPELDDSQLEALREFFEKLPEHSRPFGRSAQYDRGGEDLVLHFRERLFELDVGRFLARVCLWTSPPPSMNLLVACVEGIALLAADPARRGDLVQAGCIPALITASTILTKDVTGTYNEDVARCRQVLAQFCIAVNPTTLTYKDTLSLVPQLLPLLSNTYELYQYEAALALTNLTSFSAEARDCVYHQKGVGLLMDVATSDNALCRAAGLEGICNMAMCSIFRDRIAQGGHKTDLQLLFAFLGEVENLRAQSAAAGCLAMLMADVRVCVRLLEIPNVNNLVKAFAPDSTMKENVGFQLRLLSILVNLCEACQVTDDIPIDLPTSPKSATATLKVSSGMLELRKQLMTTLKTNWPKNRLTSDLKVHELYDKIMELDAALCSRAS